MNATRWMLACCGSLGLGVVAYGDLLVVDVQRSVSVFGLGSDPQITSLLPGIFDEFVDDTGAFSELSIVDAFATQDTNVTASRIDGVGEAGLAASFPIIESDAVASESFLEVVFELAADHDFVLTGELIGDGPTSRARFALTELLPPILADGAATDLSFEAAGPSFNTVDIGTVGLLEAGTYRLTVSAGFDVSELPDGGFVEADFADPTFEFDLTLTEVPEPAAGSALLVGMLALAGRRKRA